jgi:adenylate cyclase
MSGWWNRLNPVHPTASGFRHELDRQIMKTELIRIKTLIGTMVAVVVVVSSIHIFAPDIIGHLWRGHLRLSYLFEILMPFILFELIVLAIVKRRLAQDGDVRAGVRYVGAFIETSMPTIALALHIDNMGSVAAIGFVMPLAYFIFIILSTLRLDFWLSTFTGFVASSELLGMALFYHPDGVPDRDYHIARSVIILVCGVLAGAVAARLRHQFEASIQASTARDRVTNLFGQHVSPQVAERLMTERVTTTSDIRRVAVMFVDFRNFTAETRARTPQQVVERLDGAFAVLVEILDRQGGIVNKFLGDGFLALFGVPFETPDAAIHAVAAARDMLVAMVDDNVTNEWQLRIGIGIHFGEVIAGDIGSPRRKEYTVMGDTVNLASRIESLNKEFNSQLLISAAVHDALGADGADAELLGDVAIRGYDQPMAIWRLG